MMDKILVTGANGELGHACVQEFNATATGYSSSDLDITSREQIERVLDHESPSILLNCAAYTQVDQAEDERECARRVNARGPALLAAQCASRKIRMVHISTDYVFPGDREVPRGYAESDSVDPIGVYGSTKAEGEASVLDACQTNVVIRTAWLYGNRRKSFLRTIYEIHKREPNREFKIVNDQFGSPTCVTPLAKQIHRICHSDISGILHASSHGHTTWYELAIYFFKKVGLKALITPCTSEAFPTKATRPKNSILLNKRLQEAELDVMPTWQEGIDQFLERHSTKLFPKAV